MRLPLAYYGNPILRKKGVRVEHIDDELRQLVADMEQTIDEMNGCGLAAQQVHSALNLFVTKIPRYDREGKMVAEGELRVFINPKILSYSEETWACQEACMSIPKFWDYVDRPLKVTFEATDLEGRTFTEEFVGYDAHVMLHENDHINGVLFIDRLPPKRRREIDHLLNKIKKDYNKK